MVAPPLHYNACYTNCVYATYYDKADPVPPTPQLCSKGFRENPFPVIPGRINSNLQVCLDLGVYPYSTFMVLTAALLSAVDGSPIPDVPVVFWVGGLTFPVVTDADGIATKLYQPFAVPDPGEGTTVTYTIYACFFGS